MGRRRKSYRIESAEQKAAISSPIRMEILGHFTSPEGMSIAEIAERMGRPPATLYYHFGILEDAGLLVRAGKRPGTKKSETLYEPVASRFEFPVARDPESEADAAVKAMSMAFRMAERDLEAALVSPDSRKAGKYRNVLAGRLHCRTTRDTLAEINTHLDAIQKILEREGRRTKLPPDADEYFSLTFALLPLRGRGDN